MPHMLAVQIVSAGGIDQDHVKCLNSSRALLEFGLVLSHAERNFQDAGVSLKLTHCADAVGVQRNDSQLDLALYFEISSQFGKSCGFSYSRRSQKGENRRAA